MSKLHVSSQRQWRSSHQKEFKGKYTETLNTPLSMRFLKEPWGVEVNEHVDKINAGKWLELNFAESEFVRNIYKALHQSKINTYQMSTALLLHSAYSQFKDNQGHFAIKLFRFDGRGPFEPATIDYATKQNLTQLKKRLAKLPSTENCYFSINLPRRLEVAFLYAGTTVFEKYGLYEYYPKFNTILKKYIVRLKIEESKKQILLSSIDSNRHAIGEHIKKNNQEIAPELFNFAVKRLAGMKLTSTEFDSEKFSRDYFSIEFLLAILRTNEQIPTIEISPDYNEQDPNSPLL